MKTDLPLTRPPARPLERPADAPFVQRFSVPRPSGVRLLTAWPPIRFVASLGALLKVLRRGSLVVHGSAAPRLSSIRGLGPRGGWREATPPLEPGLRYQISQRVVQEAEDAGDVLCTPVWLPSESSNSWRPLYPMTSAWLRAQQADELETGTRLTLP